MEKGEIEEIKRYFGVVAEGLRSDIRQVAEGHEVIRNEIQTLREENEQAHREIFCYQIFIRRTGPEDHVLENGFQSLKARLDRLEARQ